MNPPVPLGQIAFVSNRDKGRNIYLVNTDGSNLLRLTFGGGGDEWYAINETPSWSPDGRRIVFASNRRGPYGSFDLYIIDSDGKNLMRLTNTSTSEYHPAWSPDGRKIAFVAIENDNYQLFTMSANGGGRVGLCEVDGFKIPHLTWSPDNQKIAFTCEPILYEGAATGFSKLCIINVDGSGLKILDGDYIAGISPLDWSPDGSLIAFSNLTDDGGLDIYTLQVDGKKLTRLTNAPGMERSPTWSPDGSHIAIVADRINRDIYYINSDGSGFQRLTFHLAEDYYPAWSPVLLAPTSTPNP